MTINFSFYADFVTGGHMHKLKSFFLFQKQIFIFFFNVVLQCAKNEMINNYQIYFI